MPTVSTVNAHVKTGSKVIQTKSVSPSVNGFLFCSLSVQAFVPFFLSSHDQVSFLIKDPCEHIECGINARCVNGTCQCKKGYKGDPITKCEPKGETPFCWECFSKGFNPPHPSFSFWLSDPFVCSSYLRRKSEKLLFFCPIRPMQKRQMWKVCSVC